MTTNNNWWDSLETIEEPYPHIPESKIKEVMPPSLVDAWENFIRGQTCLLIKHGEESEGGIYPWDFDRFISKLKKGLPLVDSLSEWD